MARTLGYLYGTTAGDWAVASGWIARAKTLLSDLPDSSERGWVALTEGMFAEARAPRRRHFRPALEIGRADGGCRPDVRHPVLPRRQPGARRPRRGGHGAARRGAGRGRGRRRRGLHRASRRSSASCSPPASTPTTCAVRSSGSGSARRSPNGAGCRRCRAYCRTHYGGILTAAGRWPEADAALTEAVACGRSAAAPLKAGA